MKRLTVSNVKKTVDTVAKPIKEIEKNVNPLEEKIDKTNTTDSGTESLKLANQGIKTTKKTVRTTKNAVKNTKNAVKNTKKVAQTTAKAAKATAKATVKVTKAAVKVTVKVVQVTAKVIAKVVTEVVAALSNPYVLLVVLIIVVVILLIYGLVVLISGADTEQKAMSQPIGLGNMEEQYNNGLEYYNIALDERMGELTDIINGLSYNTDDREHSDLLDYTRHEPGTLVYQKDFPTDYRKNNVISTFQHQFPSDEDIDEFMAIAYVYLEKEANEKNGTDLRIYKVEFTQEVFNTLIEECIEYTHSTDDSVVCPNADCTRDKEAYRVWQESVTKLERADVGSNEWVEGDENILEVIGGCETKREIIDYVNWRVKGNWKAVYGDIYTENVDIESFDDALNYYNDYIVSTFNELQIDTGKLEEIYNNSTACYKHHKLHKVEASFLDADELMDALDFDSREEQWVELTKSGFENLRNSGG